MATPNTLQTKEVLNKVLNAGEDALKVDIDNATITAGSLEVNLDNANDDVLIYGWDGSSNQKVKTDSDGNLQVDIVTAASTVVTQSTHDNLNANANIQVGDADVANGNPVPVSDAGGALTVDNGGTFAVQSTLQTGSNTVGKVHITDGTEDASVNASNQLEVAEANSSSINTHLNNMFYDNVVAVTPDDASDISGAPYYALYIGVGGDVKVDLNGTGTAITFKNLASGQMLPIIVDRVYATDTTATNILALKK